MQLAFMSLQQAQGYAGDGTLGELVEAWIASCHRLAPSTVAGYRNSARALAQELARQHPGAAPRDLAKEGKALRLADRVTRERYLPVVADSQRAEVGRALLQIAYAKGGA